MEILGLPLEISIHALREEGDKSSGDAAFYIV